MNLVEGWIIKIAIEIITEIFIVNKLNRRENTYEKTDNNGYTCNNSS
jgi:hypothetical protein